jgi:threonine/homoserine/homoserine lactone efflux protein
VPLSAFVAGAGLGLFVAAQVGPISLLCARTALRGRLAAALAVGLGAAVVDLVYACLGVAGAGIVLRATAVRLLLGLVGATVLGVLGARTLWTAWRIRAGAEVPGEVATPRAAFGTAVVATASNPLTIASCGAIFAAASTAAVATTGPAVAAMLAGVGLGSVGWFGVLATGLALVGRRLPDRALRLADVLAGLGMVGFGGLLAVDTVREG